MFLLDKPTPVDGCPSAEALAAFDSGQLSYLQTEELAEHVAACGTCNSALATLHPQSMQTEPLVGRLRHSFVPAHVTGEEFGQYILTEKIGEGGMGSVYKAWQRTLHRYVALKRLKPDICRDAFMVDRFRAEALAVAQLNHPHVVQVFDCGDVDGQPFLCMELMPGGSLADRISGNPLPPNEAALIVKKLALAIQATHQQGLLHRDLKPSNVFLTSDGVPKVGDFGLARWADKSGRFSANDGIVGSPSYMSPEQAAEPPVEVGPQADVYALGAILYEALTGRAPFLGSTKAETLDRVRNDKPIKPGKLIVSVPRGLEEICLKCLCKLPEERYRSAAALAAELQAWLDRDSRAQSAKRRWRTALLAAAAMLIVGAAIASILYVRLRSPYQDPPNPDQPINNIEARLARGEIVTLIGKDGGPEWSRWRIGGDASRQLISEEGNLFQIIAPEVAALELVRDPQVDHFKLYAELSHAKGDPLSEIGLAVGCREYPLSDHSLHFFVRVAFDDRDDFRSRGGGAQKNSATAAPPPSNPVKLGCKLYAEPGCNMPIDVKPSLYFAPKGSTGNAPWHQLMLDVGPAGVQATWDNGQAAGVLSAQAAHDRTLLTIKQLQMRWIDEADSLLGIEPAFHAREPVCLYVYNGTASFRNVRLEPVPAKD